MIDISLNWLDKIIESINFEKLPHGIIINGPIGIGKEFLSREIASRLLLNKTTKTLDKELQDNIKSEGPVEFSVRNYFDRANASIH